MAQARSPKALRASVLDWDAAGVAAFLEHEVATLPLCFDALHVVGWTDQLYSSIPIAR
jgi:hypothetical protein